MTTGVANAQTFGARGDGSTDDTVALQAALDYCFGSASSPHGRTGVHNNKVLYIPPGNYKTTEPLLITNLMGGQIMGAGRHTTLIHNAGTGSDNTVFRTNGMGYSSMSDMSLQCHEDGICIDLDWDGEIGVNGSGSLQANTFSNIFCYGSSESGTVGVRIANQTFMGSECIFHMLHNQECQLAGVIISAFNALQHQFYGGQDQACGVGIWATVGSAPIINGRGFQLQTVCDIKTSGAYYNSMSVVGCRTESENFILNEGGQTFDISACVQTCPTTPGYFVRSVGGYTMVRGCLANGSVRPEYSCNLILEGSQVYLDLAPDLLWYIPNNPIAGNVLIRNSILNDVPSGYTQVLNQRRCTTDGSTITITNADYS